jgi:DNA polymerase-1
MKDTGLSTNQLRTEVVFQFTIQLLNYAKRFETDKFIFCWDSKHSKRKKIFEDYKAKRHNDKTAEDKRFDELTYPQFDELRFNVIPDMGFKNTFLQAGLEADDLFASILTHNQFDEKPIIVSRDGDLYQLLDWCDMFDPTSKKIITAETFQDRWGIEPGKWGEVKAIAGCSTDGVPGVSGVGEKTAIKYITGALGNKTKAHKSIVSNRFLIKRNRLLVVLPFKATKPIEIVDDELMYIDFHNTFQRLKFDSCLQEMNLWEKRFNLQTF